MQTTLDTSLETAAQELWRELQRLGVSGVTSVGVRPTSEQIVVYVVRASTSRARIPKSWMGYEVTVSQSGAIRLG
jgi:hypothetical protein